MPSDKALNRTSPDKIAALQNTIYGLTDSRNFYAAKPPTGHTVTAHTLIHNFMTGFSTQAIIFDGVPMTGRAADRAAILSHANILMARPDNSPFLDSLAGRMAVTMAQAQGLLYAGFVLETAIATAAEETLAAHAAQPFAGWQAMRDYFNQSFAVAYVPFISV